MKVAFLDRDGVINQFPGNGQYVTKVKDFRFLPGAIEGIRRLNEMGYALFVITNQAGVGKGVYSQHKLDLITRHMLRVVRAEQGKINRVYNCTCTREKNCECRKPNIGSLKKAARTLKRPLGRLHSYFIGDTLSDMQAGKKGGCKTIFVLSGREKSRRVINHWPVKPDFIAKDILAATEIIKNEDSRHPRLRRSRS